MAENDVAVREELEELPVPRPEIGAAREAPRTAAVPLEHPSLQHPANAEVRVRMLRERQQQYGNQDTQGVIARLDAARAANAQPVAVPNPPTPSAPRPASPPDSERRAERVTPEAPVRRSAPTPSAETVEEPPAMAEALTAAEPFELVEPETDAAPDPSYDIDLARGEVGAIVDTLRVRAATRHQRTRENASRIATNITGAAGSRKREVESAAAATITRIRTQSMQTRAQVLGTIRTNRTEALQAIARAKGNVTQQKRSETARLPREVSARESALREGARRKAGEARQMGREEGGRAARQNEADAETARERGRERAAMYPATERGAVQAQAARGAANKVAREIGHNTHELRTFANDSAADAASRFSDRAEEVIAGIREHVPDIREPIDRIDRDAQGALDGLQRDAASTFARMENDARASIAELEQAAVAQAIQARRRVAREIDAAARAAVDGLDQRVAAAELRIDRRVESVANFLLRLRRPDPAAAREVAAQMDQYLDDTSAIVAESAGEFERDVTARLTDAADGGRNALAGTWKHVARGLTQVRTGTQSAAESVSSDARQRSTGFVREATTAMAAVLSPITTELDRVVRETIAGFTGLIEQARDRIRAKMSEALGHNTQALAQLGPSMTEAADDAAWDYDHPVLSTARDVAAFIGGLVLAILAVIAIVVIVIVAAKVLIAGLIALGVSALVAKVIVIVAGIGVAAYMVYRSYTARRARIEHEEGTESRGMTLLKSIGELTGITQVAEGITQEGLTPFERGWKIGEGIATAASWWLGPKMAGRLDAALPRIRWAPQWIKTPVRGSLPRWFQERFGKSGTPEVPRFEPTPASPETTTATEPTTPREPTTLTKPATPREPATPRDGPAEVTPLVRDRIPGSSDAEHSIDQLLRQEGRTVEPNVREGQPGAGRQGDRLVDGVLTEYKAISGVQDATSDGISQAIARRVMDGRGQALHIIVDARGQSGITAEIAERGVRRAYGADNATGGRIRSIRVIGPDFSITRPRR